MSKTKISVCVKFAQPTPVFLPGEFREQRSLAGYSPWGHKELDTTEVTEHARNSNRKLIHFPCCDGVKGKSPGGLEPGRE